MKSLPISSREYRRAKKEVLSFLSGLERESTAERKALEIDHPDDTREKIVARMTDIQRGRFTISAISRQGRNVLMPPILEDDFRELWNLLSERIKNEVWSPQRPFAADTNSPSDFNLVEIQKYENDGLYALIINAFWERDGERPNYNAAVMKIGQKRMAPVPPHSEQYKLAYAILMVACYLLESIPKKNISAVEPRKGRTRHSAPGHVTISLDGYETVLQLDPPEPLPRVDHGGTHASPISHERRGHWRTLRNGARVWVRACKVNADEDDESAPRRLAYSIKS